MLLVYFELNCQLDLVGFGSETEFAESAITCAKIPKSYSAKTTRDAPPSNSCLMQLFFLLSWIIILDNYVIVASSFGSSDMVEQIIH